MLLVVLRYDPFSSSPIYGSFQLIFIGIKIFKMNFRNYWAGFSKYTLYKTVKLMDLFLYSCYVMHTISDCTLHVPKNRLQSDLTTSHFTAILVMKICPDRKSSGPLDLWTIIFDTGKHHVCVYANSESLLWDLVSLIMKCQL